jgi:hypothetical protein
MQHAWQHAADVVLARMRSESGRDPVQHAPFPDASPFALREPRSDISDGIRLGPVRECG